MSSRNHGTFLFSSLIQVYWIICGQGFGAWDVVKQDTYTELIPVEMVSSGLNVERTTMAHSVTACSRDCIAADTNAFFYISGNLTCLCIGDPPPADVREFAGSSIVYGHVISSQTTSESTNHALKVSIIPRQQDCLDLYHLGYIQDGIYNIQPLGDSVTNVWCDMTNGGWTVIQRRENGVEEFYRNWTDYVNGFGFRGHEYWLGLETIHHLTSSSSELQIELETFGDYGVGDPEETIVTYSQFHVDDALTNYTMTTSGYNGTCGDGLTYHSSQPFTTKDNDNDRNPGSNCAVTNGGAWWYRRCYQCNLNGKYYDGWYTGQDGITYTKCWSINYSLKKTVMKIRRL